MQQIVKTLPLSARYESKQSLPFDINVCFKDGTVQRRDIERFIHDGYYKAYKADISVSMPALLYIEEKNLKAALGLRGGREQLFIEQYLDAPVIDYIRKSLPDVTTDDIVEIGNLYSNSNRFTIPLFMVTAVTSYLLGKKVFVLCGTEHVLQLLSKSGVQTFMLADAEQSALQESSDDWGSYYDTNPKAVFVSLSQVMLLIEGNEFYQKLFARLSEKIVVTYNKMKGKL